MLLLSQRAAGHSKVFWIAITDKSPLNMHQGDWKKRVKENSQGLSSLLYPQACVKGAEKAPLNL